VCAGDCGVFPGSPGGAALRLCRALATAEPLVLEDLAGRGARQRVDRRSDRGSGHGEPARVRAIERDAFTEATGYGPGLEVGAIELRDRVWRDLPLV